MTIYARRVLRPLYDRADKRKVILWSNVQPIWSPALEVWVELRMWHAWCGVCGMNECCRKSVTHWTGQDARAAMAKHWAEVHS